MGDDIVSMQQIHPFFMQRLTVSRVKIATARKPLIPTASNSKADLVEQLSISSSDSDQCSDHDVVIVSETSYEPKVESGPKWKPKTTRTRVAPPRAPPTTNINPLGPPQAAHLVPLSSSEADDGTSDIYSSLQLFFFDTETTGLRTHADRIIDLALLERGSSSAFDSRVNPEVHIPRHVTGLTGASYATVKDAPVIREVLQRMIHFVEGCRVQGKTPVLVAHNGKRFDFKILIEEAARSSISLPSDWLCLDTLVLARACMKGQIISSKKQADLRSFFDIPCPATEHNALPDAQITDI